MVIQGIGPWKLKTVKEAQIVLMKELGARSSILYSMLRVSETGIRNKLFRVEYFLPFLFGRNLNFECKIN